MLERAFACYQRGDLTGAENTLTQLPDHPSALHLLGIVRVRQGRLKQAAELLAHSVSIRPTEAQAQLNLGKVLNTLGRHIEASQALQTALSLDHHIIDAALVLGKSLHAQGRLHEAIESYKAFLAKRPAHVPAMLDLGSILIEAAQPQEAEALYGSALNEAKDPRLRAALHRALASLFGTRQAGRALEHLDQAQELDPALTGIEPDRAILLEELHRFDDALAVHEVIITGNPVDHTAHRNYNDLLYRLGRDQEFLSSYDAAPRTRELLLSKAEFLLDTSRLDEAELCYREALSRYPESKEATTGLGLALVKRGQFGEAVAVFQRAIKTYPGNVDIYCNLAGALTQFGDPEQAAVIAKNALTIDPINQVALAMWSTSMRLMDDASDEILAGYDDFIQVSDLDPPDGYTDMRAFNTELSAQLELMHPPGREYLRQSLRGGTQTRSNLFDSGHPLLEKLRNRIGNAVAGYIESLREDERHPFLSRKSSGFRFSGSWSSRLRDQGFHINHLHPGGWISSCYYVEVPEVVKESVGQQGWIKFGEPSFDVGLPARRAIQPEVGRLVLFPSYMWHGTIPFSSSQSRTTIAFDAVPDALA